MSSQQQTTTVTTTTTTRSSTTITFDMGYLIPHGILKIIECILCIVVLGLAADSKWCCHNTARSRSLEYCIAIGAIFFILTLIMLIIFLFNLPDRLCGRRSCGFVELVVCVLAILCFIIDFILMCVYCWYKDFFDRTFTIGEMVALLVISIILVILYIASLVLGFKAGKTPMVTVRT